MLIKTKIVFMLSVLLFFKKKEVKAQLRNDVNQYMIYQPFVNYASASSYTDVSAGAYYRNQWVGFNGAPVNYGVQVAIPTYNINSSFGLRFVKDKIGVRISDVITLNYSYRVQVNKKSNLAFSFSPKIGFVKENRQELIAIQALDPTLSNNIQQNGLYNAELGTYYYRNNFYFGGALPNLLRNNLIANSEPQTYFDLKGLEWFIHSGYEHSFKNRKSIGISTLIKSDRGVSLHGEFNLMFYTYKKRLGFGVSYRTTHDLVVLLKINLIEKLYLGYGYQYNFSSLSNYQSGSHELMLVYELKTKKMPIQLYVPRF